MARARQTASEHIFLCFFLPDCSKVLMDFSSQSHYQFFAAWRSSLIDICDLVARVSIEGRPMPIQTSCILHEFETVCLEAIHNAGRLHGEQMAGWPSLTLCLIVVAYVASTYLCLRFVNSVPWHWLLHLQQEVKYFSPAKQKLHFNEWIAESISQWINQTDSQLIKQSVGRSVGPSIGHSGRQAGRRAGGQPDRQTGRQTDRQTVS